MSTPASHPICNVVNQTGQDLDIYRFAVPQGASAANPATLYPTYTKVGSAARNATTHYTPSEPIEDLAFALVTTGQPVATVVTDQVGQTTVTITNASVTSGQKAFSFLQAYWGSPYSPASLALNDIVLTSTDLTQQQQQVNAWLTTNTDGFDYDLFAAVTYWAENDLRAWGGAHNAQLFCYDPAKPQPLIPLVLPTTSTGTISLKADGTAEFAPTSGAAIPLKFAKRTLASAGATQTSGTSLSTTSPTSTASAKWCAPRWCRSSPWRAT